ncbi:MAG: SDR family NAD(P)-dependent oxidoreductase [Pseudomonadota bacterium]
MNSVVFGASGGIGRAVVEHLLTRASTVIAVSRSGADIPGATSLAADFTDETEIAAAAAKIGETTTPDLVIVASGLLSGPDGLEPEKSYRHQSMDAFQRVFAINTFAPALVAKHMFPLMPRKERAVFAALSARVGSISDNRMGGWHAYRASKAALNMLIRNFAIEQARRNPNFIVVGLHPGTVDTGLSKPFQSGVPDTQLFTPSHSAGQMLDVLESLTPDHSGQVFDYAGEPIAP